MVSAIKSGAHQRWSGVFAITPGITGEEYIQRAVKDIAPFGTIYMPPRMVVGGIPT